MDENSNIDLETDERPPSVLNQIIKDPEEDVPFSDIKPLPETFGSENLKLKDWKRMVCSLFTKDRLKFCILMHTFANDGSFTMTDIPKSFKKKHMPTTKLGEEEWVRSFQYVAKTMDLEMQYFYKDKIKEAADKLTEVDDEGKGPFLKKSSSEEDTYSFLNDIIFDAATHGYILQRHYRGLALAKPVFLYRYCLTECQYRQIKDYEITNTLVSISQHEEDTVFDNFIEQICQGQVYNTVANRMFEDEMFCGHFFRHLNQKAESGKEKDKGIEKKIFTAVDVKSKSNRPKSLLYCLIVQNPPRMFLLDTVQDKMTKHCKKDFMDFQYNIIIDFCCRKALMDVYLKFASKVEIFPFSFIRSAVIGNDSVLLDRVLSHQQWNQTQLDKAMQWIAMKGKFDDYLRIKQAGGRPNTMTLYESAIGKNISILEDILRDGIDCESDVYQGRKVIHAAAEMGNVDIIDMLIQRGADIESRSQHGELPLHISIDNNHEDLAEHLLMRGADANLRDNRGATALIRACARGLYRLVERLIYVGADVQDTDTQGCNILHKAYLSGEIEIIDFAKSNGFKIDSLDNDRNSVLHYSAINGNLKQFEALLDQMPSMISSCNKFDWTPASCAAIAGRFDIFQFLKRNGSDIQQITIDGRSILDLAIRGKNMRLLNKTGNIKEFQEKVNLGSLSEYDQIIASFEN